MLECLPVPTMWVMAFSYSGVVRVVPDGTVIHSVGQVVRRCRKRVAKKPKEPSD